MSKSFYSRTLSLFTNQSVRIIAQSLACRAEVVKLWPKHSKPPKPIVAPAKDFYKTGQSPLLSLLNLSLSLPFKQVILLHYLSPSLVR